MVFQKMIMFISLAVLSIPAISSAGDHSWLLGDKGDVTFASDELKCAWFPGFESKLRSAEPIAKLFGLQHVDISWVEVTEDFQFVYSTSDRSVSLGRTKGDSNENGMAQSIHEIGHSVLNTYLHQNREYDSLYAASFIDGIQMMKPYQEMFADLFAVIVLEDPRAMAKVALSHNLSTGNDFTIPFVSSKASDEFHYVLDPTRSYIFQKLMSSRFGSTEEKAAILRRVAGAIQSILLMELRKDLGASYSKKSLAEKNGELMALLIGK